MEQCFLGIGWASCQYPNFASSNGKIIFSNDAGFSPFGLAGITDISAAWSLIIFSLLFSDVKYSDVKKVSIVHVRYLFPLFPQGAASSEHIKKGLQSPTLLSVAFLCLLYFFLCICIHPYRLEGIRSYEFYDVGILGDMPVVLIELHTRAHKIYSSLSIWVEFEMCLFAHILVIYLHPKSWVFSISFSSSHLVEMYPADCHG